MSNQRDASPEVWSSLDIGSGGGQAIFNSDGK